MIFIVVPLVASATTVGDIETEVMYMLGQIAVLKAEQDRSPVACALVASTTSVAAHAPFELIWNSFGAKDPANTDTVSQWAQSGISTVILDTPGIYEYKFVFYGVSGGSATCMMRITIRPRGT